MGRNRLSLRSKSYTKSRGCSRQESATSFCSSPLTELAARLSRFCLLAKHRCDHSIPDAHDAGHVLREHKITKAPLWGFCYFVLSAGIEPASQVPQT